MPLYDYECNDCGHIFELKQSFTDEPLGICPQCQGRSRRKFHAVPIIYKGTGFYTTDYARSGASSTGTGVDHSTKKDESKSETKKEESSKSSTSAKKEDSSTSSSSTPKKET